ncbi:multidrug ABC transporter ATP-binding protein [Paenibacillus sambharensis]|uniref:Multidrug ABC transporter ATP-binding protein n=1 Tax=Paenibacillus sambharensis TaxID=1803190 RepID=A0A2W1LIA5_9BACL|nr:ABC transporter ATP-binding protein [Paenibacillus sambharensis]PZD94772.1 multidrug ABC transporter ATP-binding protein [Paenibacillus sambharensis]
MSIAVRLSGVSKKIKGRTVLDNVTITLEKGKVIGFVGHNGSGKSMLFRIITGLVKPSSGEVTVLGETLNKEASFAKNTSVILEKPGFLDHYSGYDNLKFLADIQKKIGSQQIHAAIQRVGLDPADKRPVKSYSLGMKQKLAIAQAIMEEPDLILLDEPMNGLDEEAVSRVYSIIREEIGRGATILLASHHKVDIETLCNEVYKVNSGVVTGAEK